MTEPRDTADKFRAMMEAEELADQPYLELWDKHQETLAELHEAKRLAEEFSGAFLAEKARASHYRARKDHYKAVAYAAFLEVRKYEEEQK